MNSKPRSQSNLAALDAVFEDRHAAWWDSFYSNRGRPVPFFVGSPDESLWKWVNCKMIPPGRALDLGCGNGRNAIYLARSGFSVEGVDYSGAAIEWAAQQAKEAGVDLRFHHASVFGLQLTAGSYDLIYDSGAFITCRHIEDRLTLTCGRRSEAWGPVCYDLLSSGRWKRVL